ncbi:MAG: hypothetical protein IPM35_20100 [Myxococcales bacterium]|nr:hypothetical protein [Myxococcales bacterium]
MPRSLVAALFVAAACSPAPEPKASSVEPALKAKSEPAASSTPNEPDDPETADASAPDAEAAAEPVYKEPAPVVVRRHHVFTKLEARAGKRVTLTSLLTTASDDHPDLEVGTEATLQHKPKGKTDWADLAQVRVVSLKTKTGRFGTSEQAIAVELQSEVAGSPKGAYVRGAQLRLQVDRPEQPPK